MSRICFYILMFWWAPSICHAQINDYELDGQMSNIQFSVTHMGLLTVTGHFKHVTGNLSYDRHKKLIALRSTIYVNSIDTEDTKRDQSIISEAYLHESKYPYITFKATQITSNTILGILQIKNIKKEIQMPYTIVDARSNTTRGLKIETLIRRSDFNLDFGAMNLLVGDEIRITLGIYVK